MRTFRIIEGDCLEALKAMPDASVDACVTDPPYELGFMGKKWDASGIAYNVEMWREVFRVLKPGAHLLSFGGTRTYHRMACAIEDAGFEIRDCIQWLYGSGFPKSLDVSKAIDKLNGAEREPDEYTGANGLNKVYGASMGGGITLPKGNPATSEAAMWQGWGTALKPANEPIVVARKPLAEGNVAANVLRYGTGAINVDASRVGTRADAPQVSGAKKTSAVYGEIDVPGGKVYSEGRWPANVIFDEEAAQLLDGQTGELKSGDLRAGIYEQNQRRNIYGKFAGFQNQAYEGDSGGASRFFYCAKADSSERNAGLYHLPQRATQEYGSIRTDRAAGYEKASAHHNHHPTVKPLSLMCWLVRLVTPAGGVVLDPFTGSGSTGIAALREGFNFIGIEREAEYVEIARQRITGDAPLLNTQETAA